jgi:LPXTG-motif cell wall-anchored protein
MDKGLPVSISTGSFVSFSFNCRFVGYDTGYWHIPPVKLIAGNQTFFADTSFIQVNYANSDLSQPFRDTKPLMELPEATPSRIGWFIGLGLLLLLSLGLYLFYKRKRRGRKLNVAAQLSLASFLQQVELLEEEYQRGNLMEREFYERWIEILRKYIRWQTGKISTDQGTRQIVESMKIAGMQEELRETLAVCLMISEKARFACHRPDDAANKNALKVLKAALETKHLNS